MVALVSPGQSRIGHIGPCDQGMRRIGYLLISFTRLQVPGSQPSFLCTSFLSGSSGLGCNRSLLQLLTLLSVTLIPPGDSAGDKYRSRNS